MIGLLKRLFKREPQPDVLVIDHHGGIKMCASRIIGRRRVVEHHGDVFVLAEDGTVRGSYWAKTWEAL